MEDNEKMTIEQLRAKWKPQYGSGKSYFNRIKKFGQSWTELRSNQWTQNENGSWSSH
jgi:hypothetical protein